MLECDRHEELYWSCAHFIGLQETGTARRHSGVCHCPEKMLYHDNYGEAPSRFAITIAGD
jgi:hypothetical protein